MSYSLEFHEDALKEWNALDGSIKVQFRKQLENRMKNPQCLPRN
jgi:mRNA interferase RelE/StbE